LSSTTVDTRLASEILRKPLIVFSARLLQSLKVKIATQLLMPRLSLKRRARKRLSIRSTLRIWSAS